MKTRVKKRVFFVVGMLFVVAVTTRIPAADPPAPPKVSTYAPASDLVEQSAYYLKRLEATVAKESLKENEQKRMERDAHTLTVLLLALGMHDEDNRLKAPAPELIPLAQKLAESTEDLPAARKALEQLTAAMEANSSPVKSLTWERVASLGPLMEQVPNINNRLRRSLRKSKFEKDKDKSAGYSAALAVIAQASIPDLEAVKDPNQTGEWYKHCIEMRDSSGEINEAVHAQDYERAAKAMKRLQKSCDDCHEAFRIETD